MDSTHFHFFSLSSFSPPPLLLVCEFWQELPMDSDVFFWLLSVRPWIPNVFCPYRNIAVVPTRVLLPSFFVFGLMLFCTFFFASKGSPSRTMTNKSAKIPFRPSNKTYCKTPLPFKIYTKPIVRPQSRCDFEIYGTSAAPLLIILETILKLS